MKYTKEIPTKPGWYWVRATQMSQTIGEIVKAGSRFQLFVEGLILVPDNLFEYAGPIEEPEE